MILHTQPRKRWNEMDFMLAEAYQKYLNGLCPQCGMPRYLCGNDSNDIQYHLREDYCAAKAAVDERRSRDSKAKDYEPPFGVVLVPEPYSPSGASLDSFQYPYLKAQAAKYKAMMDAEASKLGTS